MLAIFCDWLVWKMPHDSLWQACAKIGIEVSKGYPKKKLNDITLGEAMAFFEGRVK